MLKHRTPPGNADVFENKGVAGKAIGKTMKTKELQIDGVGGATRKCLKTPTESGQAPSGQNRRVWNCARGEREGRWKQRTKNLAFRGPPPL